MCVVKRLKSLEFRINSGRERKAEKKGGQPIIFAQISGSSKTVWLSLSISFCIVTFPATEGLVDSSVLLGGWNPKSYLFFFWKYGLVSPIPFVCKANSPINLPDMV